MGIKVTFAAVSIGVFGNLIASALWEGAGPLAAAVTRLAVRLIQDAEDRQRYGEEFRAHLAECETSIGKLKAAAGFVVAGFRHRQREFLPVFRVVIDPDGKTIRAETAWNRAPSVFNIIQIFRYIRMLRKLRQIMARIEKKDLKTAYRLSWQARRSLTPRRPQ